MHTNKHIILKALLVFFATTLLLLISAGSNVYAKPLVHPFYVSVTEINYKSNTKSLEISCKMFAEDIEQVLKLKYNKSLSLTNDAQKEQNNKFLNDYLTKHLFINTDAKLLNLKFVGFEKDRESIYCYFEVDEVAPFKKVVVRNNILTDYKDEQINILHIIYNGDRKSGKSDAVNTTSTFGF